MAASTTITTMTIPKNNINGTIPATTFNEDDKAGYKINEVNLTQIINAISNLEVYAKKVSNCSNCTLISSNSTSCQTIKYVRSTHRKTSTISHYSDYYDHYNYSDYL